jgi:hypothetical protein
MQASMAPDEGLVTTPQGDEPVEASQGSEDWQGQN